MEALYEQNLLLWERVELYKSNITENEVKAMNANAKIKDVGRIAEERRREAFNHLRGASKLRDGKGQELQHSKHEESEAMKTVMAMRSKLGEAERGAKAGAKRQRHTAYLHNLQPFARRFAPRRVCP